jgi:hypothetical protein
VLTRAKERRARARRSHDPNIGIKLPLDAGLGLVVPLHARLLLAVGLRGSWLDGLSNGLRRNQTGDAQGNDGRDRFHGVFLHLPG